MNIIKDDLRHLNTVTHQGKVLVFGTAKDGMVWYTVKQDGYEATSLNQPDGESTGWEAWHLLPLPADQVDASVLAHEDETLTYEAGDERQYLLRSRYQTNHIATVGPVQLVSSATHLYVFRQAEAAPPLGLDNEPLAQPRTLLVDRFVLDGLTNKLNRAVEVRYKKSGQKYEAASATTAVSLELDVLDYRDETGTFFYEPTVELSFINQLYGGWFSVVLLPTADHDCYYWHIFAYNQQKEQIEIHAIRALADGSFDLSMPGVQSNNPTASPIIQRTLELTGLTINNGPVATTYAVQERRETQAGMRLLKMKSRVLLAVPTTVGTAVITFAIATNGTLSQPHNLVEVSSGMRHMVRESLNLTAVADPQADLHEITYLLGQQEQEQLTLRHRQQRLMTSLQANNGGSAEQRSAWETALAQVEARLTEVGHTLNDTNERWLARRRQITPTSLPLPTLYTVEQGEQAGLVTQGGLLTFVRPVGRMTILESHQGDVQLCYFDEQGQMRQLAFDTVVNAPEEVGGQWQLPQARAFLNFEDRLSVLQLNTALAIGDTWSLETWFAYPFRTSVAWHVLVTSQDGSQQIAVQDGHLLGLRVDSVFYGCGYDLTNIVPGWHHMAVVSHEGHCLFYVDGQPVGQAEGAFNKDIAAFGMVAREIRPFSRLAEIRVWQVALSAAEVAINSKTTLTGHEPGLIAYYPCQEMAETVPDKSGYVHHATLQDMGQADAHNQAIVWDWAALRFDGVDDHLTVADDPALQVSAYTVELWLNPEVPPQGGWSGIIGKPGRNFNLWLHNNAGLHHSFHTPASTGTHVLTENSVLQWQTWQHVAITNDGTTAKTYINGRLMAEISFTGGLIVHPTPLYMGRNPDGVANYHFKGAMSDVRLWDRARSQAEIEADMSRRLQGDEAGLVAYWPFTQVTDEANVLKVTEVVQQLDTVLYDGQLVIDAQLPLPSTGTASSDSDQVMLFATGTNYIHFNHPLPAIREAITIEFWAKGGSSLPKRTSIFEAYSAQNQRTLNIHLTWDAGMIYWQTADWINKAAQPHEYKGEWVHWAFTKDCHSGVMTIYYNGEVWHQVSGTHQPIVPIHQFVIGAYVNHTVPWHGSLAEFRIWHEARSQADIQADMHRRLHGKEPGLVAYWPLNSVKQEGANLIVSDYGGDYDGLVYGAKCVYDNTFPLVNLDGAREETPPTSNALDAFWWGWSAPVGHLQQLTANFDGLDRYIEVPFALELNPTTFTLCCWVKARGEWGQEQMIISSGLTRGYKVGLNDSGLWQVWLGNAETDGTAEDDLQATWQVIDGPQAQIGVWTHVAITFAGQQLDLYINGHLIISVPHMLYRPNGSHPLVMGQDQPVIHAPFSGQLAEVQLWQQAHSQATIQAGMHQRLHGDELNLVAYWPLTEISADKPVADLTGHHSAMVHPSRTLDGGPAAISDNVLPISPGTLLGVDYYTHEGEAEDSVEVILRQLLLAPTPMGVQIWQDKRLDYLVRQRISQIYFAPTILGYVEGVPPIPSENLRLNIDYDRAATFTLTLTEDLTVPLALRGVLQTNGQGAGYQFKPKNMGYALSVKGVADLFITYLLGKGMMVAYEVVPLAHMPPTITPLTFLINPAYTQQGNLDGFLTPAAAVDVGLDLPEERGDNGRSAFVSYYRREEAEMWRQELARHNKQKEAYLSQFTAMEESDLDISRLSSDAHQKWQQWQAHLTGWQHQVHDSHLLNAYLWDAEGGLWTKKQQKGQLLGHHVGGNVQLWLNRDVVVPLPENHLTALHALSLVYPLTTAVDSLGLKIDLSDLSSSVAQVSRYHFMSFYATANTQHFHDLYENVVDPEWLAGDSQEARLMSQAVGRANRTWRVFHRVTAIERSAVPLPDQVPPMSSATAVDLHLFDNQLQALQAQVQALSQQLQSMSIAQVETSAPASILSTHPPLAMPPLPIVTLTSGQRIALQADTGQWLARCNQCQDTVGDLPNTLMVCASQANIPATQFEVVNVAPGKVALKADNGCYVTRCQDVLVNSAYQDFMAIQATEPTLPAAQFTIRALPNGKVALQADSGKYMVRCRGCSPNAIHLDAVMVYVDDPWTVVAAQWQLDTP